MEDSYTAFFSPGLSLFSGDVNRPEASGLVPKLLRDTITRPCLSYRFERLSLDAADTRSIEPITIGVANDNVESYVVLKVIGEVQIQLVGQDKGMGTQNGYANCYGTEYLPGVMVLCPHRLTSITIEALEDSTVDVSTGVLVQDGDARI